MYKNVIKCKNMVKRVIQVIHTKIGEKGGKNDDFK